MLRAAAFAPELFPSEVETRTYLFLQDVPLQNEPDAVAAGWPTRFGSNSRDLGMDPDIVEDPVWGPQLRDALAQIPSMSVVTHFDNLFDPATGRWHLRYRDGYTASFFYGMPGDTPLMGDWDCDGTDTVAMYRESTGFIYYRNRNSFGIADCTPLAT